MNEFDGRKKFNSLISSFTDLDRRRSYYLSLATCYCTPSSVRKFIKAVCAILKIKEINLYIDRRTAISVGHAELIALKKEYDEILSIFAIRTGRLFHTKGYCITTYDEYGDIFNGRLALGSVNMTDPGLTNSHGNIESLAIYHDPQIIEEFLEFFNDSENLICLNDLTKFSPSDEVDFRYALLTSGLFSHKWSASLSTYFSVRYSLNQEARRRAAEVIGTLGFSMEAASIANAYFDFDVRDWRPNDKNLVKYYGIECTLGHWIPKSVIESDEEINKNFEEFKAALFRKLDSEKPKIMEKILQDYKSLKKEGVIELIDIDPKKSFQERVEALRVDNDQLYRIYSGRAFFEFPYDPGDIEKIKDMFNDIVRTAHQRRKKNKAMRAVLRAESQRTIEPITMLPNDD